MTAHDFDPFFWLLLAEAVTVIALLIALATVTVALVRAKVELVRRVR